MPKSRRRRGGIDTGEVIDGNAHQSDLNSLASLATLYGSAQRFAHSLDLNEIAQAMAEISVGVLGGISAWVGRVTPRGTLSGLGTAVRGSLQTQLPVGPGPVVEGAIEEALRTSHPVLIHDPVGPELPWGEQMLTEDAEAAAVFPLVARDESFGALVVFGARGFFLPETIQTFKALSYMAGAALANAQMYAEANKRLQRLDALRAIDTAILQSFDLGVTLDVFLYQVTNQLNVEAAAVLLLDDPDLLTYAAVRGFASGGVIGQTLPSVAGMPSKAIRERRTITTAALGVSKLEGPGLLGSGEYASYAATPLISRGEVRGVLEVFHHHPLEFEPEWIAFMEALAGQAAIAVENTNLVERLRLSNLRLTDAYDATLGGWSRFLELRDRETQGHTERVAETAVALAREMGMSGQQLVHVRRGALLHDIGKMGVPDAILNKPGPLNAEEIAVMQRHPVYSYELLAPIAYLRPALDIPYCHHERWDGNGYPRGLVAEQIPLSARVFAVVDVWDALISDRPYRDAWPKDRVVEHIRSQAGVHFEAAIAETFLAMC